MVLRTLSCFPDFPAPTGDGSNIALGFLALGFLTLGFSAFGNSPVSVSLRGNALAYLGGARHALAFLGGVADVPDLRRWEIQTRVL